MKLGTSIAVIAAMALAIVATPDTNAKAWWGWHGMNMKIAGSSFSVTTLPDGTATAVPPFTAIQNGVARGKYGKAQITSQTFAGDFAPAAPGECPETLPLRGPLSIIFVLTYNDGSILSARTTGDNSYCTDGTIFVTNATGEIIGGERRFKNATGTWDVDAKIEGSRMTGKLAVDLD